MLEKVFTRKKTFLLMTVGFLLSACGGGENGSGSVGQTTDSNLQLLLTPSQINIKPGGAQLFSGFVIGEDGNLKPLPVQWSSNSPGIVSINSTGIAKGRATGSDSIIASIPGRSAQATLQVDRSAPRPTELVDLFPLEESTVHPPHCPIEIPCSILSTFSSATVKFIFQENDSIETAKLSVDGAEITPEAKVIDETTLLDPEVQGAVVWDNLFTLSAGKHALDIQAKSKGGKIVSYDWTFMVAKTGILGKIVSGPTCPAVGPGMEQQCQPKPFQASVIVKDESGSKEITRFTSDVNGRFTVILPPGTYGLEPIPAGNPWPFGKPQTVKVDPDQFTEVTMSYDTGIR